MDILAGGQINKPSGAMVAVIIFLKLLLQDTVDNLQVHLKLLFIQHQHIIIKKYHLLKIGTW